MLAAGLHVGLVLDRDRLRRLRRELRSREALGRAAKLLSRRDLSARGLDSELERRRVAPVVRQETVARLVEAGAVDDTRSARRRAELLAARGTGNLLIRADLDARGFPPAVADEAIEALAPEAERARRIVGRRGTGLATVRYLMRKGFDEEAVEAAAGGPIAQTS